MQTHLRSRGASAASRSRGARALAPAPRCQKVVAFVKGLLSGGAATKAPGFGFAGSEPAGAAGAERGAVAAALPASSIVAASAVANQAKIKARAMPQ